MFNKNSYYEYNVYMYRGISGNWEVCLNVIYRFVELIRMIR